MLTVLMSGDMSAVVDVGTFTVPAGCLLQARSFNDETNQVVLESLDEFNGVSQGLFVQAMEKDLIEISLFTTMLLRAEKQHRLRLLVCRDENWLEEAIHIFEESDVLVSCGAAQLHGTVRYVGPLQKLPPGKVGDEKWFGVEVTYSNVDLLRQLVPTAGDGSPHFKCENGRGLYVTICSIRLADVIMEVPFEGKKPFSARTRKSETLKQVQNEVSRKGFGMKPGWSKEFDVAPKASATVPAISSTVIPTYEINDRVVWIKDDNRHVRGTVRFIGEVGGSRGSGRKMALELDSPEGDDDFTGMHNAIATFKVQQRYGVFRDEEDLLKQLMRENDYGYCQTPAAPVVDKDGSKKAEKVKDKEQDKKLKKGDRVVWYDKEGVAVPGEVKFVGNVPEKKKDKSVVEKVGVLLDVPKGDKNFEGKSADGKQLFPCKKGHGILVGVYELMLESDYKATLPASYPETPQSAREENPFELLRGKELEVGDEVMWIVKAGEDGDDVQPERGTIRYIGSEFPDKYVVEFRNKVGQENWTGKHRKKQLFESKPGHARVMAREELMLYDEFKARLMGGVTAPSVPVEKSPPPSSQPARAPEPSPDDLVTHHQSHGDFELGDRVAVVEPEKPLIIGTLRWIGVAKRISNQYMYGVETDEQVGEHDNMAFGGIIGDAQSGYAIAFNCKPGYGKFASTKDVKKLKDLEISDPKRPEINFRVGDRVILLREGGPVGTVRWKDVDGHYPVGSAVGVQLDKPLSPENASEYSGVLKNGSHTTDLHCPAGCGIFVGCDEIVPCDDAEDVKNSEEGGWTVVGAKKEPQPSVAPAAQLVSSVSPSVTHPVFPGTISNPKQPLLPPPTPVAEFVIVMNGRVFTYFDGQKVYGTVKWLSQSTKEAGVIWETYVPGTPGGIHNGIKLFDAPPGYGSTVLVDVLHPVKEQPGMPSTFNPGFIPPPQRPQFLPGLPMMQPIVPLMQPALFPPIIPLRPQAPLSPPRAAYPVAGQFVPPRAGVFPAANSLQPILMQPPRPSSRTEVEEAIRRADEMEKLLSERQSHVEIFRMHMEEQFKEEDVMVKIDPKFKNTSGFVKILPRTDEPYPVVHIANGEFDLVRTVREVQYFPPVFIHFEVPDRYPNVAPVMRVECNYVPQANILNMVNGILDQWRVCQNDGNQSPLYEALRVVRNNVMALFGVPSGMTITSRGVSESGFLERDVLGLCVFDNDKEARVHFERIHKFNDKKIKDVEERDKVECSICADRVAQLELSDFSAACPHLFCRGCITNHVRAQVEQGNTTAIRCPGDGCDVQTTLHELADVVSRDVFEAFGGKLLDQSLATMNDIMRCPHCTHAVVFEAEMLPQNERYITCPDPKCGKQYCPWCRGKDHGDQPCMTFEQKRELRNSYVNGSAEEKARLEQLHGKDNIKHAIEDFDAEETIRTKCKICPNCKTPTEKADGCNHMTCPRCHTHFCWLCGQQMPERDPYSHFANGQCNMYQQGGVLGNFLGNIRPMARPRAGYQQLNRQPHIFRAGYARPQPHRQLDERFMRDFLERHRYPDFNRNMQLNRLARLPEHGQQTDQEQIQEQAWRHPELYIFE
ncbi:uncharacterized protein LOC129587832 isoform X2 [Paramacrobiotus metropolitanus]|nr:uncharacterized protein LOC129587832 isoform X2 [Paramacrobiotus metropolitanus]